MQLSSLSEGSVMDPFSAMLAFASTILNLLCLGPRSIITTKSPRLRCMAPETERGGCTAARAHARVATTSLSMTTVF
mgnify:CR=1